MKIFDPLRKSWVEGTPEEEIRQGLIAYMIGQLGYPKQYLVIEKALSQLPHLKGVYPLPNRRIDILCYSRNLQPLLMIECKSFSLKLGFEQVIGYNCFVKARFIGVYNGKEMSMGYYDLKEGVYQFVASFPAYEELSKAR